MDLGKTFQKSYKCTVTVLRTKCVQHIFPFLVLRFTFCAVVYNDLRPVTTVAGFAVNKYCMNRKKWTELSN